MRADAIAPGKTAGVWIYKAAGGGLNIEINGKLRIRKVDSKTGEGLAGAKFRVTKGDKSFELTSNEKGIALSENLELGEYNVTEITAPEGYKATDEVFTVNVTSNGGVLTIKNTKVEVPPKEDNNNKSDVNKPEPPKPDENKKPEDKKKPDESKKQDETKKPEDKKKPETPKVDISKDNKTEITDNNTTKKTETPKVETSENTVKKPVRNIPNTGDNTNILLYGLLFACVASTMTYSFRKRNK